MAPEDAHHTAFRTPIGVFYYIVMPFRLKNAGTTYQHAMMTLFHDMLHKELEFYVDDLVVKSLVEGKHLHNLCGVFNRCRAYNLRMNLMKCVFSVTAEKFLECLIHCHGIEPDPTKTKGITNMPWASNQKELKSFLRKVSYLRRFIPALAEITYPFSQLLKKAIAFQWSHEHEQAFTKIKELLTSPRVMISPQNGRPLLLYLTSTIRSIGALLAQEIDGTERPIYYISRVLQGAEQRYSPVERHCLALVFVAQKLRHYLLAYPLHVITKCDPIHHLLSRPAMIGCTARWLLALAEFDI